MINYLNFKPFKEPGFINSHLPGKQFRNAYFILAILTILSTNNSLGQIQNYWTCFHGPERTNKSVETGLMNEWPENGPVMIWEASGLGEGYSTVSFGDGLLYTAGTSDGQTYVFAFDMNGERVWKESNHIPQNEKQI